MAKAPKIIPAEEPVEEVVAQVVETGPVLTAQTLAEIEAGKIALARKIASHHAELSYSASKSPPAIEELIKNYTADQSVLDDLLGKL